MKTKLLLILPFLFVAMLGSCNDNDDDSLIVDTKFDNALKARYPDAVNVKWEREGAYTVADFYSQSFDMEAWFDSKAEWMQSETEYGPNLQLLPDEVRAAFAGSEYADWDIEDVSKYERPDITFYVIDIEKVNSRDLEVYYHPDGTLIQAIPDIADITPDTPIP